MNEEVLTPRNFQDDLAVSNNPTLRKSWETILKLKFGEGCVISWKDQLGEQIGFGVDVVVKTKEGRRYSIELKTRNINCLGKDWIMEIISHRYDREEKPRNYIGKKEGWIYTTTAEYILHGTLDKEGTDLIEVMMYSLMPFKTEKWKGEFDKYQILWLPTLFDNGTFQLTLNKLIPEEVIKEDSLEFWKWVK